MKDHPLSGVYAASITPLNLDGSLATKYLPEYLAFLANRGCHGALLLGTTGEGPSFSVDERLKIFRSAVEVRQTYPAFRLLAGTGTTSITETILLSKTAFDLGFDGVVVLPPYYFHQATSAGLYHWFRELIHKAVPKDGYILGYHFPTQSGVPIPLETISKLKQDFPNQFAGFKDSTKGSDYTFQIGNSLADDVVGLVGNDRNLSKSLNFGGAGCITAMANLLSPDLREIWNLHNAGNDISRIQAKINKYKGILEKYQPYAPTIKALVSTIHKFPEWGVRLPLTSLPEQRIKTLLKEIHEL